MSTNTPNPSNPAGSSNEPTGASGSTPSSQPNSELEAAVDRAIERKVTPMMEDDRLNRKTDRLRGQVGWLMGITIASVLNLAARLFATSDAIGQSRLLRLQPVDRPSQGTAQDQH